MTALAVEGFVTDLGPLDEELQKLVPLHPGEIIAFPDIVDNPAAITPDSVEDRHPNHTHAGMYGLIKAIGYADGGIKLDLLVFDPAEGVTENATTIYRADLKEIQ